MASQYYSSNLVSPRNVFIYMQVLYKYKSTYRDSADTDWALAIFFEVQFIASWQKRTQENAKPVRKQAVSLVSFLSPKSSIRVSGHLWEI